MADTTIRNKVIPSSPLRRAMRANGIFSGASGAALLVAAGPISRFTGVGQPAFLAVIGVLLVGYAALLFWSTNSARIDRRLGVTAVVLDLAWVAGSAVLLLTDWVPFTTAGQWTVGLLAEVVFWFAVWQGYALLRKK